MFNLSALIKLIDTTGDSIIQLDEMNVFMQSQNQEKLSIFDVFFKSIKSDISVEDFQFGIERIIREQHIKGNYEFDLSFKQEEVAKKYEQIKLEMQIKSNCYSFLGYRFKSDEEFNLVFSELISKYRDLGDDISQEIIQGLVNYSSKNPVDWMARLNTGKFKTCNVDFQNIVFEDVDLSKYSEAFKYISFNENTFRKVSPEHLPQGFNPHEVFEKGKTIGLGIEQAHKNGYTGTGVSYAIIDSGTKDGKFNEGKHHNDIHFTEYKVSQYSENKEHLNSFHGRAVSYIAQEIAPQSNCYYYATHCGEHMDASVLENLKSILEKNKTWPDNQKIRFVSMSMPLYGGEEAKEVVKALEAQGVWVYYSNCPEDNKTGVLSKKDPNGDPNDFDNYEVYGGGPNSLLFVNSGDRTVPDSSSPTAYRHDSVPSQSYAVPVIAGYYILACQADSSMTKERFIDLASETARVVQPSINSINVHNSASSNMIQQGNSMRTVSFKIIDINALLQRIEEENAYFLGDSSSTRLLHSKPDI